MRVEAAPFVFRPDDRRQRFHERRAIGDDRRTAAPQQQARAQHAHHLWFQPAFGAHILGQIAPEPVLPARAERAYLQPEAKTPRRPSIVAQRA